MSLPTGDEKTYLEITPTKGGFVIEAEGPHGGELEALFRQHGITCQLDPDAGGGKGELVFSREADVSQVKEILDAYKAPKGS